MPLEGSGKAPTRRCLRNLKTAETVVQAPIRLVRPHSVAQAPISGSVAGAGGRMAP
ncbi:hypothetical protein GCM10009821_16780 [Aeromicrobium halocynthiae]|uniref:Uncharacterized protein n=1 Tax=Aeromicrobium halocynthiae TaxID=560557 RepID=A0ABN2W125_9ACTN